MLCATHLSCWSRSVPGEVFAPVYSFLPFFATCHVAPGVCVWLGYSEVCRAWRAHFVAAAKHLAAPATLTSLAPWQVVATSTTCDKRLQSGRLQYVRQQQTGFPVCFLNRHMFFCFATAKTRSAGPQKTRAPAHVYPQHLCSTQTRVARSPILDPGL